MLHKPTFVYSFLTFLLFLLFAPISINAQLALESDINQKPSGSNPANFLVFNNIIYFSADDGAFGKELWKHDINTNETSRITDINPFSESSSPSNFYIFQDKLFFSTNGVHGFYVYDPADESLMEITAGESISPPASFMAYEGMLYFSARAFGTNTQLYRYNPNTEEIAHVLDLNPEVNNDNIGGLITLDGVFYFTGNDQINGAQFWTLDVNTFEKTLIPGVTGVNFLTVYNDKLYFGARDDQNLGTEFFEYDPATQVHRMIMDISSGATDSSPNQLIVVGDKLVFSAKIFNVHNFWVYDGSTDIVTPFEINTAGSAYPNIGNVTEGVLHFSATPDETHRNIYTYDPVANEVNMLYASTSINGLIAVENEVYFSGFDVTVDQELFIFDKTTATASLLEDINITTASANPNTFTAFDGKLYFNASDEFTGAEMWAYDPLSGTTAIELDQNPGEGNGRPIVYQAFDNRLFMSAYFPDYGYELGYYDPTANEMILISDIMAGVNNSTPQYLTPFNDKLYFTARSISTDSELYVYDPVTNQVTLITTAELSKLFVFNNELYGLYDGDPLVGRELYRIDVNTGELTLVVDINPGEDGSGVEEMIIHDGKLFFVAYDNQNAVQLRAYDPVTEEISTYSLSSNSSNANWLVEYDNQLYMSAQQNTSGVELYRFDVVTETFELVVDIIPNQGHGSPRELIVFNDKLYFSAFTPDHGRELWEYDAATDEAHIVTDIWAGPSDSRLGYLTLFNDKLYFAADDGIHGTEVWSLASCLNAFVTTMPQHEGSEDGSIDVTVVGGTPPYHYAWNTGETSEDIGDLSTGEYTLTVTDDAGCIDILTAEVAFIVTDVYDTFLDEMQIYPNPATEQLHIDFGKILPVQIILTDIFGRTVINEKRGNTAGFLSLNVHHLPVGVYQLSVYVAGERVGEEQVVISR